MKTYYRGELYVGDKLTDTDLPERQTAAEARDDVLNAMDSLSERERRGVSGAVILWQDDDGNMVSQGCEEVALPERACD